ncbi:dynamin family protein (plasmid) [Lysinibacillus capsici]|uniref:dynamin family protein n=1 Tax=Lysinibacillus capsici TaxID=2115968 RepID=UPI0021DB078C|nr:dynamin family protein [Lysinibacillus capsici]UYB49999.1 dynamin family protein [Lysinibacillus capsici]
MNLHLQQHQKRKESLLTLLTRSAEYFAGIGEDEKVESLKQFSTDLQNGDFSIVIVGEFSAGKSTFLNAVMGDRYLPSFTSETTATINFLKHVSKSPNGHTMQIDYKNPSTPTKYGEATKESIAKNVSTLGGDQVVQDIESVTLYLNSPLLEQGITLVDSPGLNGVAKGHAEVTERQIERSHACIYMFAASQPGSKSDFEVLAKLSERFDNIFLVLNQIDKIKQSEETVESVVNRLRENYLTFFPDHKMPEIYPIAAYPALVSRTKEQLEYPDNSMQKDHDADARARFLELSRIGLFEQRLWKFVTDGEKTIQELRAPAEMIQHELAKRSAVINETLESLADAKDADEINVRIQEVEADLQIIRENLEQQKGSIQLEIKELVSDIENSAKSQIEEIRTGLESKINGFTDLESIQTQIERINRQVNRECEQIVEHLDDEFTSSLRKKMNSKYQEIAVLANDKIAETAPNSNSIRTIAFEANTDVRINMDAYDQKTKEIEQEMEELRKKTDDTSMKKLEAIKVKRKMDALESQMIQIQQEEQIKLSFLGERPAVERHTIQTEHKEGRGGIFGFIGNVFLGKKSVTGTKYEVDDSAQRKYDEEREQLRKEINDNRKKLEQAKNELYSKESVDPEVYDLEQQRIQQQQLYLQQRRDKYIAEYSEKLQQEQQKVLTNIRYEFEDYLTAISREISKMVRTNIRGKEEQIAKVMIEALDMQFEKQSQEKQAKLQELVDILQSDETERAEKRKELEQEKQQLKALAKDVLEFISEIDSINVDVIKQESKQTNFA